MFGKTNCYLQAAKALSFIKEAAMTDRSDERADIPQPAEDPDTGASGSTDERSSENRQEGLEKEPDDKLGEPDEQ